MNAWQLCLCFHRNLCSNICPKLSALVVEILVTSSSYVQCSNKKLGGKYQDQNVFHTYFGVKYTPKKWCDFTPYRVHGEIASVQGKEGWSTTLTRSLMFYDLSLLLVLLCRNLSASRQDIHAAHDC